ncbi:MAG: hypothetical protein GY754_41050 [bacterium]|nr:hypothetical protein [bacterium]
MSAAEKLSSIIQVIVDYEYWEGGDYKSISNQYNANANERPGILQNINTSFLLCMSGKNHPLYNEAHQYLNSFKEHSEYKDIVSFYLAGINIIAEEIKELHEEKEFRDRIDAAYTFSQNQAKKKSRTEFIKTIRRFFFPEGDMDLREKAQAIEALRQKREVQVVELNTDPIRDPASEILFTSNVLLTLPSSSSPIDEPGAAINDKLKSIKKEDQLYWYDHPIQIGTRPENNELIYGLENLNKAFLAEKTFDRESSVDCVLSVSVTHKGLHSVAKDYIEKELQDKNLSCLNLFAFTEAHTKKIIDQVIVPAADYYGIPIDQELLHSIFGVDGEYGRHYNFLKAVASLRKLTKPSIRGTFKIDLDQVFPQEKLKEETGLSLFEHFRTPLWGARGIDSAGKQVYLGMIAGALVNDKDFHKSLYTPDVLFPAHEAGIDSLIFYSTVPQALSTEAEMMARYGRGSTLDGEQVCLHRIHVTGGTNGILVEALNEYRPFTPSIIGRAEDQSYLMSVLLNERRNGSLRYVHRDGLIMRHDKETFAGEAIEAARIGKIIGDYIRILLFSFYARALPWEENDIKDILDPFTGSFINAMPFTIVYLRFALKAADMIASGSKNDAEELILMGSERLPPLILELTEKNNPIRELYEKEKKGWDVFYDIIKTVQEKHNSNDSFAEELLVRLQSIMDDCRIQC